MRRLISHSCMLVAGVLTLAVSKRAAAAPTFSVPGFVDETLYQGNGMISMRFDYAGRLWVIEKVGRVLVFEPTAPGASSFNPPSVFADLSAQVSTGGETGMTGLALDPDLANNGFVYVLHATGSDQRIVRLTANETFTSMVPGSALVLLSGLSNTNTVHKAGDIHFHPNDPANLYVAVGDDGLRYDVADLDNYLGKILKISASDGKGLVSNPYYNGDPNSVRSRIWSARYRNPFRFTFDPVTNGDYMYISENGDGTDRIVRIEKGGDGAWPTNEYLTDSADGKRMVLNTSDPSKTGVAIFRSGPFAPEGTPVIYAARYGGGDRNVVNRWNLVGTDGDAVTPVAADNGNPFYSGFTEHGIVSFTAGPDGALYFTDSGQGASTGNNWRLGRIRFVGGTQPVAGFTASPSSGQSPLQVSFTDTSTAPDSSIASWSWSFGDGATSTVQNPVHSYAEPGVFSVSLTITNALGLAATHETTVLAYHETAITLTGQVLDGQSLPATNLAAATELRFYQKDGVTPLAVSGGTGSESNILAVPGGGVINATFTAQITGDAMVVSAGEAASDGVQAAFVGIPLSTTSPAQNASATFYLSDTLLRGRVTDTNSDPARVDIGVSRATAGDYYGFAGGRDFLAGEPSGQPHRVVADDLGYYHVPIRNGTGGATFHIDTTADTLTSSHGSVTATVDVSASQTTVKNLVIGLYNGGINEADLSGIAVTPNVDFATQIQPIFTSACVACHTDTAVNSFGLDLQSGAAYSELVDKESVEAPGVKLVQSGSAARSYLMEKINAAVPQAGTSMRPGDPMPLAQQALVRDWINQLTPPDPDAPPEIDSALAKSGVVSQPLTYQITAINIPTSFGATNLPAGLNLNSTTGVISGTPTAAGTFNATITATNLNGIDSETLVFTITAGPPPEIVSPLAASGAVNTPFTYTIMAENFPASFGATGLPAGFSLDTSTGVISGTPTETGSSNVTITATNANGTDTRTLVISFVANLSLGQPTETSSFTSAGRAGSAAVDSDFVNSRWESDSSDPQWIYIDLGATKVIRKVVLKWEAAYGRDYQVQVSNSTDGPWTDMVTVIGNTTFADPKVYDNLDFTGRYVRMYGTLRGSPYGYSLFNFEVWGMDFDDLTQPPSITSPLTANGIVNTAFSYQITATQSPTSYGATGLPAGLGINTATGEISGTPTGAGSSDITITATNANGTDTETLALTVSTGPLPVITSPLVANGTVNAPFSYTIAATNSPTDHDAIGLPAGLSINPSTGVISGTPGSVGSSNVSITATNAHGTDTRTLVISIASNLVKLSLNMDVTASSFQPGNEVAKGNDSDINSRWAAADGSYPQWWRVDLGEEKLVSKVEVKWFAGRIYHYFIEVSTDDADYTEVANKVPNTVADFTTDTFTPVAARYVRITVTGGTGFASFMDASVFGSDIPIAEPVNLAFDSATYSAQESSGTMTATVLRTGSGSGAVGVTASTVAGGSATAGSDFTTTTTVLTWEDGDLSPKNFTFPVLADSLAEGDETVAIQLSLPTGGAVLGTQSTATFTIVDRPFDAWRSEQFGANANDPEAQPMADFDHDGRSNLLEFALSTDPALSESGAGFTVDPQGGDRLKFLFTRPLQTVGLILRIRASDTLESDDWDTLATKAGEAEWTMAPDVEVSDNPVTGAVIVTDSELIGDQPKRFLQLEAELP